MNRFVAYYRVSTDKQNRSGLGLEAQRAAVQAYVAGARSAVAAEFVEVESGRKKDRPQLAAALAAARAHRAVLVIAMILARTKARGVRLGNPNLAAGSPAQARAANAVKTERAQVRPRARSGSAGQRSTASLPSCRTPRSGALGVHGCRNFHAPP